MTLQGCAEIIVAGGAAVVVTAFDPRSMGTIVTDQTSEYRINKRIRDDKLLAKGVHINTTVYNRILLLTGEVPTRKLKLHVSKLARDVKDIKSVKNYLSVRRPSKQSIRTADAALTTRIKANMVANDIDLSRVRVITERRVVYLLGLASKEEQKQIKSIAKETHKVLSVVPLMTTLTDGV